MKDTTAPESQGNGLATLAFLGAFFALPFGAIAALGSAVLAHAAWGRCVREPNRGGRTRTYAALILSHLAVILGLGGFLAPPGGMARSELRVDPAVIARQRKPELFESGAYDIVSTVVAEVSEEAFGFGDDSRGYEKLLEQARAAGGDDVAQIRREIVKDSLFATRVRKRYFGVAIIYRK